MKRIFLSALVAMTTACLQAQPDLKPGTFSITPKVGMSLSNLSDMDLYTSYGKVYNSKYKPGITAGVDVQYQVNPVLSVSAGVQYAREGCRFSNIYEETPLSQNSNIVTVLENYRVNLDYIQIPLMAHGAMGDGLSINGGIQVGFLVGAHYKSTATNYQEVFDANGGRTVTYDKDVYGKEINQLEMNEDWKSLMKKVNVSIPVGLSYEYSHVVLDARYNIPLIKNGKLITASSGEQAYLPGEMKSMTFLFTVGYRFEL